MSAKPEVRCIATIVLFEAAAEMMKSGFELPDQKTIHGVQRYVERFGRGGRGKLPSFQANQCVLLLAAYTAAGYIVKNPDFAGAHADERNACSAVAGEMQRNAIAWKSPELNIDADKVFEIYGNHKDAVTRLRNMICGAPIVTAPDGAPKKPQKP